MATIESRPTSDWGRLMTGLGYWLGWARVGFCETVTRAKLWSDPPCTIGAQINCSGGALSESFSGTTASLASEE
jgi:hypothetical protein